MHTVPGIMYDYEPYNTSTIQRSANNHCILYLAPRANNDPVPPPPLKLNIDIYMVLEAWHGFQPQLVEPFMKNLVLLFRHEYSVSGHHHAKSWRSALHCLSDRPEFERVAFATPTFAASDKSKRLINLLI